MEQKSSRKLRLIDIIISLFKRDQIEEGLDWILDAVMLGLEEEVESTVILRLSVDEVVELYTAEKLQIPNVYGFDKVWYGERAFRA